MAGTLFASSINILFRFAGFVLGCELRGDGEGRGGAWQSLFTAQIYTLSPGGSIPHFSWMPEQLPTILRAGCHNVNMMTTQ